MNHYSEFVQKHSNELLIEHIGRILASYCKTRCYAVSEDNNFITIRTNDLLKKRLVKSVIIPKNMDYSSIVIELNPREEDSVMSEYEYLKKKYNKTKFSLDELHYGTLSRVCDYIEDFIEMVG